MSESTIPTLNLEAKRGDTFALPLEFSDEAGVMNITGWTVIMTVKINKTDADPGILQKKVTTHTSPTTGETLIDFTATEMTLPAKAYLYDIQITDTLGAVYTQCEGSFVVTQDITTATS